VIVFITPSHDCRYATFASALRANGHDIIAFVFLFERHESPQRYEEKTFSGH